MWVALLRAGGALAVIAFLMQALRWVLNPMLEVARAGPHSGASTVTRVSGYFSAMTVENLTLLGAVAVGIFLLGRAAVQRRVS